MPRLSRNKIDNFIEYVDNWDTGAQDVFNLGRTDLAFSPDIIGGSTLLFQPFKGFRMELLSKYVGKQYIDNTSSDERKLNPYLVNNLTFNYDFSAKLFQSINISLIINNIFDTKYESNAWVYRYIYEDQPEVMDGYFPQAGINYLLSANFKF